jgi:hypothetical protein
MTQPIQRLGELAQGQWGLFTKTQAEMAGVGWTTLARLNGQGLIHRVAHGVYRIGGTGEPDHLGLRAAWLQLEPGTPAWARFDGPEVAIVSHASAASLYDIGDLRADVHEFTLPVRKQTRRPDVRLHRGTVGPGDWQIVRGLPTTRAGLVLADLIADGVDLETVARMTAEVTDRLLDYPDAVTAHLGRYAKRFGFTQGDGQGLFEYLLALAGRPELAERAVA